MVEEDARIKFEKFRETLKKVLEVLGSSNPDNELDDINKLMETSRANGMSLEDVDAVQAILEEFLLPVIKFGKDLDVPKKISRDELGPLQNIPFKETILPLILSGIQGTNESHFGKYLDLVPFFLKMMCPDLDYALKLLRILTKDVGEEYQGFTSQLSSIFLEQFKLARKRSLESIETLFNEVKKYENNLLPLNDHLGKSDYERLGLNKKDPSWKDVLEAIYLKQDLLFALDEDDISNIVKRLASDLGNLIEERLKLILFTAVNLASIALNRRGVDFGEDLGYYAYRLHINRKNRVDFIDWRNVIHHRDFTVIVDQDQKIVEFTFVINRKNKYKEIIFSREVKLDLNEFLGLFKTVQAFLQPFDYFFKAWEFSGVMLSEGQQPSDFFKKCSDDLESIKKNPEAIQAMRDAGKLFIQNLVRPPTTNDEKFRSYIAVMCSMQKAGLLDGMKKALDAAAEIKPDDLLVLGNYGWYYLQPDRLDLEKGHCYLVKANTLYPDNVWLNYNLACVNALEDNVDASVSYLKKSIDLDESVKERAKNDPDLTKIRQDSRFIALIT